MSDEKRRIFTHPDIVQAGNFVDQYNERTRLMICGVCHETWSEHSGWACGDQPTLTTLPVSSTTTITTTCPRCSATIDPAAVEQHHAVCFRVGDYIRLDMPTRHLTGEVRSIERDVLTVIPDVMHGIWYVGKVGQPLTIHIGDNSPKNLRRIQRPGQAVVCTQPGYNGVVQLDEKRPTLSARLGHLKHGPGGSGLSGPCDADCRKCEIERNTTRAGRIQAITELAYDGKITGEQAKELLASPDLEPTAPTLYDGLTAADCYMRWCDNRACVERGGRPLYDLTPAQIAEGRATYQYDLAAHWPLNLRARISAAKERERLTVTYCEVDVEDEPWR